MTTRTENTRLTVATAGKVEGGKKIGNPDLPVVMRGDEFCRPEFHTVDNQDAVVGFDNIHLHARFLLTLVSL